MSKLIKKTDKTAEQVLTLAIAGASFSEIKKELSEAKDHEIEKGFDSVICYFKSLSEFNPEVERGKAFARLEMLFLNSLKIQDYKTSLSIQREMNKLLSLYGKKDAENNKINDADIIDEILNNE